MAQDIAIVPGAALDLAERGPGEILVVAIPLARQIIVMAVAVEPGGAGARPR